MSSFLSNKDTFSESCKEDINKIKEEFEKEPDKFIDRLESILEENMIEGRELTEEERHKIINFLSLLGADQINKIKQMLKDLAERKINEAKTKIDLAGHQYRILENINHRIKEELRKIALMEKYKQLVKESKHQSSQISF